jgi:RNA polymerase sigma factor (sigma-70 family)
MTPRSLLHPARLARKPVLSSQSDERLVDLVRAGYEPAFETIVERYRGPLTRYVKAILPSERAEDAVQQSFLNAYEAIRRDDAELKLRPWLYRIAHNAALNGLRDRGLVEQPLDERIDGVERPDQVLERRQGLAEVIAAVQELPERQRDAIVLRELEGRSYEEISAVLGVTGGAVRQLLHRARSALRTAATAATPVGLLTRIPWAAPAEPVGARVADVCGVGAAAGGALATKVCATALVTGAVIGGVAVSPEGGDDRRDRGVDQAQAADRDSGPADAAAPVGLATGARGASGTVDDDRGRAYGRGHAGDDGDARGQHHRDGDDDRRGSNSGDGDGSADDRGERLEEIVERDDGGEGDGRGRGGHSGSDNSGEGGDDQPTEPDEDRSGSGGSEGGDSGVARSGSGVPGGGGSGSGSGSGSGVSGGSGSSGGEPGTGGSGSGSTGSGSGSTGSGSGSTGSGSGSSGSGSGSGSDALEVEAG